MQDKPVLETVVGEPQGRLAPREPAHLAARGPARGVPVRAKELGFLWCRRALLLAVPGHCICSIMLPNTVIFWHVSFLEDTTP